MPNLSGKSPVILATHQMGCVNFIRGNAYVNLNDLAATFGKRIDNWTRLQGTRDLLEAFAEDPAYRGLEPIKVIKGGDTTRTQTDPSDLRDRSESAVQQGTWAHPDIAIQFAQWCSPKFSLWVSRQIRHLLEYGEVNLHYQEWTQEQFDRGVELNRDDIRDLYS
jgi:hypothetical protein